VAGAIIPISRVPARATDLLSAASAPAASPVALEDLVQAPIGRVDAFGVGRNPQAVPVENEGGR
ncbi:MAG: hypothetical protein ACK4G5_05000, partial [Devosia sp.]